MVLLIILKEESYLLPNGNYIVVDLNGNATGNILSGTTLKIYVTKNSDMENN